MNLLPHIERFRNRFAELEDLVASANLYDNPAKAQSLLKEHSRLKLALAQYTEWERLEKSLAENRELASSTEAEMVELAALAREELPELELALGRAHRQVLSSILPPDENEERNVIVEIRGGDRWRRGRDFC
ncbi:MAG: PCRF domain-containing protein, partial [Blastochloris sp.]|nr:PCRF domain-containing protein [Blastochloris sp.]